MERSVSGWDFKAYRLHNVFPLLSQKGTFSDFLLASLNHEYLPKCRTLVPFRDDLCCA